VKVRGHWATGIALALVSSAAGAWGSDGHSIVAEIAQRRLSPAAREAVERVLGDPRSLASVSSWADDYRAAHAETANWHFVDIPLGRERYDPARDCPADPAHGDCIVAELLRLRSEMRCAPRLEQRRDALRFAVHFVADVHQPLHTVAAARGGNDVRVSGSMHGETCRHHCELEPEFSNLHALWDTGLIRRTAWSWGAYVDRLESGILQEESVRRAAAVQDPVQWANESHAAARAVWNDSLVPVYGHLDDRYYRAVHPILDRQLALAGVRLAQFLNEAYASDRCEASGVR